MTLLLPIVIGGSFIGTTAQFSGFYHLDSKFQDDCYAGAWLLSVKRFLSHESDVKEIGNLEGASHMLYKRGNPYNGRDQIGTRDYFDYFVEHMSSTTNTAERSNFDLISKELSRNAEFLYQLSRSASDESKYFDTRQNQTLAFLVYYSSPASKLNNTDIKQVRIRDTFLNITFWSVYRYFPHIAIFVGRQEDYLHVQSSHLPYYALENVYNNLVFNATELKKKKKLIPRLALLSVNDHLKTDWKSKFNYLYFTEGDQLLHLRRIPEVFDAIGEFILTVNCNE